MKEKQWWKLGAGISSKNRKLYLDLLRVIATVFVIGVHTVSLAITMVEYKSVSFYVLHMFNSLFLSCNLLFVLISGALLLPVKGEKAGTFYRKRLVSVVLPMVVCYVLYVCAKEGLIWLRPDHWLPLLRRIGDGAPFEAPHFWLIYVIIGLYVLTPLLRCLIARLSDRMFSLLMAVIFVVCAVNAYLPQAKQFPPLGRLVDSYIGTFLLGYFLAEKCSKKQENVLIVLGVLSFFATLILIIKIDNFADYSYNNVPTMMFFASAIFLSVKRLAAKKERIGVGLSLISRYSYSILLLHWGVLHVAVKQILHVNVLSGGIWGGCLCMMTLTLVISLIGAVLLEHTLFAWLQKTFRRK